MTTTLLDSPASTLVSCDIASFSKAFQTAALAAAEGKISEALRSVLVTVEPGGAILEANNRELMIQVRLPQLKSEEPIHFLLPAAQVNAILASIGKATGPIRIRKSGEHSRIEFGDGHWLILGENPNIYARLGIGEIDPNPIEVMGEHLAKAIHRTVYAVNLTGNHGNYAFGGVHFSWEDRWLHLNSADGRRFAIQRVPGVMPDICPDQTRSVPPKLAAIIHNVVKEEDSAIVSFTGNSIRVDAGEVTISGRTLEGIWPDASRVFQRTEQYQTITLNREDLLDRIAKVSVMNDDSTNGVDFHFDNKSLVLTVPGSQKGSGEQRLDLANECRPGKVRINPRLLVEPLGRLDSETVNLEIGTPANIVIFECENLQYAVMPLDME